MRALFLALCAAAAGCVPYTSATQADQSQFAALWARDLAAAEQHVATARHTGAADGWTEVAQAWIDLANCDPVDRDAQIAEPAAAWAHATLVAAESRRALALAEQTRADALYVDIARSDFFSRGGDPDADDLIVWPSADEAWADERPAATELASNCETLSERVANTPLRTMDELSPMRTARDWFALAEADLQTAVELYTALPPEHRRGAVARLDWELRAASAMRAHQAANVAKSEVVRLGRGRKSDETTARAAAETKREAQLREQVRRRLSELQTIPEDVAGEDAARLRLLEAMYALEEGAADVALQRLAQARDHGIDARNFWAARYLELRIASDAARWDVAAELADALPPPAAATHGAYFYRVAVAMKQRGEVDRFLNTAMKAFRDRDYARDPFLRALYWEMLQTLADVPFEERVVELLEELGHRGDTALRVEEYARTALDRGQPDNADAAARWLLARSSDSRDLPRYHGILAVAAFIDDDVERFTRSLTKLTERPQAVAAAIPDRRRAQFFAHADAELATVLRQLLPAMAEWGDDRAARDRRQRWLRIVVLHAQQFVRHTDNTLVRPQLVELYRLASSLLEDHPRGYAERVGEREPAPLLLGTVRVERRDLAQFEPSFDLVVPYPYSLVLVPRDRLPMTQWPRRWPDGGSQ